MRTIEGLFLAVWSLLAEMSPYLLFGFFVAGILYILIPREKIYKHFSRNNLASITKASLFGVPLPLCSCGVIPVTAHLRKEGAGKGAAMAFLVSTPATGVDSILATYSLLGPVFAVIRPVAALLAGFLAGTLTMIGDHEKEKPMQEGFSCTVCSETDPHSHSLSVRIKAMFRYAFFDLVGDTGKWIILGVVIGGLISYLVPTSLIQQYLGDPKLAYPLMVLIGLPMYVCATGSIPIAASLILKGMTPGAGLVFLITGPASNTATISFVLGKLGKRSLVIYLFSITVTAVLSGMFLDSIWFSAGKDIKYFMPGMLMMPEWVNTVSGILLVFFILNAFFRQRGKKIMHTGMIFSVPDMECRHCVKTIKGSLQSLSGVSGVNIDLKKKEVEVTGDRTEADIRAAVEKAGYTVVSRIK
ncbi:MAG: SO_0444 family Cu/Zn efflux transporter [bacterium]|nr:SO_0444 family Cu/Zn efflux transporter [bacterium]